MLGNHKVNKVYLACGSTDLRKSIDGLAAIVQRDFKLDPFKDAYFVFCGHSKNRIKILHWEGNGFCLYYKRLEEGRIDWPMKGETLTVTKEELNWLLNGIRVIANQRTKLGNVKYAV